MKTKPPVLTDFSISEYQRERDVIAYCYLILEELGGDGGPTTDTLEGVLFRVYEKAQQQRGGLGDEIVAVLFGLPGQARWFQAPPQQREDEP